ncbi:hypothetical protein A9Q96_14200 [Rhodobacterales bacterium 52_120_T64]|nr:hypothetical protein A9Q96_14200 [Rhodobacterales bacterium 52_120_T64]
MKFLTRSIVALFLFSVTIGLLLLAVGQVLWAVREAQTGSRSFRPERERVFVTNIETFKPVTIAPQITAFGRVQSWRSIELRAAISGALVQLSPSFRDGGAITDGQVVFQIDPAKSQSSLALLESDLQEAEAELSNAVAAIQLVQIEVDLAQKQLELRSQALVRQEGLKARGVATDAEVENAALSVASAEQAIVNQRRALAQAQTRIISAEIALDRKQISATEAKRLLTETSVIAPFDGVVSNVTAILGRMVSANEKLGDLIDPEALEVAFRVSSAQYARLLDSSGRLKLLPVTVQSGIEDLPFELNGTIDREGAEVGEGQTGRLIYARLSGAGLSILRPGDFLSVTIIEQPLNNVAVVPATSVSADGNMLVLDEDNRLEEIAVDVLRRQANDLILSDVPFGREFVTTLTPQIGQGIQIRPLREADPLENAEQSAPTSKNEMIVLDPGRKARLLEFLERNGRMPADVKARLIAQLSQAEVAQEVVERLEESMTNQ